MEAQIIDLRTRLARVRADLDNVAVRKMGDGLLVIDKMLVKIDAALMDVRSSMDVNHVELEAVARAVETLAESVEFCCEALLAAGRLEEP